MTSDRGAEDVSVKEFPPLAFVEDFPLHSEQPDYGWWACEHPERRRDEDTSYDWRCGGCVAHAEASVAVQGDRQESWQKSPGGTPETVEEPILLSWLVARARYWGVR